MKRVLAALVLAITFAGTAQAATTSTLRNRVIYMQHVMGVPVTTHAYPESAGWLLLSPRDIVQEKKLWRQRFIRLRHAFANPPHKGSWLCIHRYEGSWTDPNAPYYGGLQMDLSFQHAYGGWLLRSKGTADRWTPLEQMWVAEHAHRSGRGFYPWPNTARYCGLI